MCEVCMCVLWAPVCMCRTCMHIQYWRNQPLEFSQPGSSKGKPFLLSCYGNADCLHCWHTFQSGWTLPYQKMLPFLPWRNWLFTPALQPLIYLPPHPVSVSAGELLTPGIHDLVFFLATPEAPIVTMTWTGYRECPCVPSSWAAHIPDLALGWLPLPGALHTVPTSSRCEQREWAA